MLHAYDWLSADGIELSYFSGLRFVISSTSSLRFLSSKILPRPAERVGLALEGRRFASGKMALPPPGALSGPVKSQITVCADRQSQKGVPALCTPLATPAR